MNWPAGVHWSPGYQLLAFVKSNTLLWAQGSNVLRESGRAYHTENHFPPPPFFFFFWTVRSAQKTGAGATSANMCIRQKAHPRLHPRRAILSSPPACVTRVTFTEITFLSSKELVLYFRLSWIRRRAYSLLKCRHGTTAERAVGFGSFLTETGSLCFFFPGWG